MDHPDATRWNDRYLSDGAQWRGRSPRRLLLDYAHLLPDSGLALDAAAGVALHGLFLAERGLHVIALDISEIGLRLALRSARERGLRLETAVLDLGCPWLPPNTFDVIVNFRFLERATFPIYRRTLKPGGVLFFETFQKMDSGHSYPDHYLEPGELARAFRGFEVIQAGQGEIRDENGRLVKKTSQLIARKPPIPPIVSIVGKSKSGKTTLLEKLTGELKRRGYRIGTVKHHSHPGFGIDRPGKDSWRHAQAGSDHVVIAAPDKIASIRRLDQALTLDEIAAGMADVDIILTDGFKRGGKPLIEVVRAERSREMICRPEELLAVVADFKLDAPAPQFDWRELEKLVSLLENTILKPGAR